MLRLKRSNLYSQECALLEKTTVLTFDLCVQKVTVMKVNAFIFFFIPLLREVIIMVLDR